MSAVAAGMLLMVGDAASAVSDGDSCDVTDRQEGAASPSQSRLSGREPDETSRQ